jgi:hypothetical protein
VIWLVWLWLNLFSPQGLIRSYELHSFSSPSNVALLGGMGIGVIAYPKLHSESKFFCAAFSVGLRCGTPPLEGCCAVTLR